MKLRHLLICTLASATLFSEAVTITLTPGSLSSKLSEISKTETSLTLTGEMDMRDFNTLVRDMPWIKSLDLKDVTVTAYEAKEPSAAGPMRNKANALPQSALLGLKLSQLTLPASLQYIDEGALAGGEFEQINLPSSLESIADNALYGCKNLKSITLPSTVSEVGAYAFASCTNLRSADLSASKIKSLGARAFAGDTLLSEVKLPSSLTLLDEGVFAANKALHYITLPSSITTIGTHAFTGSGLKYIAMPSSVTTVGDFAFSQCNNLTSATLANSEAKLGRGIFFADPNFVAFQVDSIASFPDYLFAGDSKFKASSLTKDLEEAGAYSLKDTGAESLTFGSMLVYLGDGAMENMSNLKAVSVVSLGDKLPEMGEDVFAGINQGEVELTVADDNLSTWENAEQWKEFKIVPFSLTGVDEVEDDAASVRCRFSGTLLVIDSPSDMDLVEVYDPSGAKVAMQSPNSLSAEIETSHFSARVYIVRVYLANGETATFKLMR